MTGLIEGKLAPPPTGSRCVCSEDSESRAYVEPLSFEGESAAAWQRLVGLIAARPLTQIEEQTDSYLRALTRTKLLRFTDVLEFRMHTHEHRIHVRSVSLSGLWDLGVNRKRVESIREEWTRTS